MSTTGWVIYEYQTRHAWLENQAIVILKSNQYTFANALYRLDLLPNNTAANRADSRLDGNWFTGATYFFNVRNRSALDR
jgi:hypothetical protein